MRSKYPLLLYVFILLLNVNMLKNIFKDCKIKRIKSDESYPVTTCLLSTMTFGPIGKLLT